MTEEEQGVQPKAASLTKAQQRALRYLSKSGDATPADIGYGMDDGSYKKHMKAQGAGRIGGAMAWRLVAAGLVHDCSKDHGGFTRYRISAAGRAALAESQAQ